MISLAMPQVLNALEKEEIDSRREIKLMGLIVATEYLLEEQIFPADVEKLYEKKLVQYRSELIELLTVKK